MQAFPHTYRVTIDALPEDRLQASATGLPLLEVDSPLGFGGPGDRWSPEDLLMASVSSCLVLSFRAIAKASGLQWLNITCESSGTLDKVERTMKFTRVDTAVRLVIPAGEDVAKAEKVLAKAETSCLISNSLSAQAHCDFLVEIEP